MSHVEIHPSVEEGGGAARTHKHGHFAKVFAIRDILRKPVGWNSQKHEHTCQIPSAKSPILCSATVEVEFLSTAVPIQLTHPAVSSTGAEEAVPLLQAGFWARCIPSWSRASANCKVYCDMSDGALGYNTISCMGTRAIVFPNNQLCRGTGKHIITKVEINTLWQAFAD